MNTILIISECAQQEYRLKELFSERYTVPDYNGVKKHVPDMYIITAQAYAADFFEKHPEYDACLSETPGMILWENDDSYRLMSYRNCRMFSECKLEKSDAELLDKFDEFVSLLSRNNKNLLHLSDIQSDIHSMYRETSYKGIIEVEYYNFARIYQFVDKLIERSGKPMQTLLLSLVPHDERACTPKDLSYANEILSKAIQMTLRKNDVMTNYSDSQMLVLLVDADDAGGHFATNRIISTFFGLYEDELYQLDYDIRPVGNHR
ncbi:MAG: hypothetical protein IKL00_04685 [Oscillospiraceae bacterium]|nr:hypothetical protein [Oscillospiraceae bacterium]